jgi:hypothetical protein
MFTGGMVLTRDDEVAGAHAAISAATLTQADASEAIVKLDLERIRCTDSINNSSWWSSGAESTVLLRIDAQGD